ncbi:helix-turn-helix transcriptional regulator [bacterium]|nr:helix-turn-helix transcriptional regulator [bacterium]
MDKDLNLKRFGKRLREIRKQRKLTQEELAERIDLSTNFVGMVERGQRNTTIANVFKMSKALGIKLSKFFETL